MSPSVKFSIEKIEGQGIDIQRVVEGLKNLKAELIELGCNVSVKVAGMELEAGNGTRTRDILLGNFRVTPAPEPPTPQYTSQFGLKPPEKTPLICEHFEEPDDISCEYCLAYDTCPLHFRLKSEVKK
jgi:hypothetical protein